MTRRLEGRCESGADNRQKKDVGHASSGSGLPWPRSGRGGTGRSAGRRQLENTRQLSVYDVVTVTTASSANGSPCK